MSQFVAPSRSASPSDQRRAGGPSGCRGVLWAPSSRRPGVVASRLADQRSDEVGRRVPDAVAMLGRKAPCYVDERRYGRGRRHGVALVRRGAGNAKESARAGRRPDGRSRHPGAGLVEAGPGWVAQMLKPRRRGAAAPDRRLLMVNGSAGLRRQPQRRPAPTGAAGAVGPPWSTARPAAVHGPAVPGGAYSGSRVLSPAG